VIEGNFKLIDSDNFGNLYALTATNVLEKRNGKGDLICRFSDKTNGPISSFDVTNPMRVIVYFKEFNRLSVLDNTLTITATFDMNLTGLSGDLFISSTNDNGFWVYEVANGGLNKYNSDFILVSKTENLPKILGIDIQPVSLLNAGNNIFISSTSNGLLVFDQYGNYKKAMPSRPLRLHLWKGQICFLEEQQFCSLEKKQLEVICEPVNQPHTFDVVMLNDGKAYLLNDRLLIRKQ
jgi:hypothetical protein